MGSCETHAPSAKRVMVMTLTRCQPVLWLMMSSARANVVQMWRPSVAFIACGVLVGEKLWNANVEETSTRPSLQHCLVSWGVIGTHHYAYICKDRTAAVVCGQRCRVSSLRHRSAHTLSREPRLTSQQTCAIHSWPARNSRPHRQKQPRAYCASDLSRARIPVIFTVPSP